MERPLPGAINAPSSFEEDMSSVTICHGDVIPGYNPEMSFLKLLQSALEEATPSTHGSHMEHLLHFENQHSSSAVKPKVEQMESCITHEVVPPKPRRRKRAGTCPTKRPEEVECQRRTHITVERNRRRLMNEHFATLKSLIPPYLVQRGDQASIVGGAINFVKELEQELLSLQAEKQSRRAAAANSGAIMVEGFFFNSAQYSGCSRCGGEGGVDVEARVVQGHVNLKVVGRREGRQLPRVIAALQELGMIVLHLMVTAVDAPSVLLYCFNLKMEEGCRVGSADEVAAAVHQIFSFYTQSDS